MRGHSRILVVEDDRLLRMDLTLVLEREGFTFDIACSAEEAFDRLDRGHYDLVLTDLELPGCNGYDVLRAAKRADPATKVVLVSGSQSSAGPDGIALDGFETAIVKPFALAEFVATVRRFLPSRPPRPFAPQLES